MSVRVRENIARARAQHHGDTASAGSRLSTRGLATRSRFTSDYARPRACCARARGMSSAGSARDRRRSARLVRRAETADPRAIVPARGRSCSRRDLEAQGSASPLSLARRRNHAEWSATRTSLTNRRINAIRSRRTFSG